MRDIARLANVSMPTVSRVLNDSPLVTGETRARVLEVAQANGYAVNRNAKKLRQARTGTIAVMLDFASHRHGAIGDPFTMLTEEEEVCCGFPLFISGQHDMLEDLTKRLVNAYTAKGVKTLVCSCPCCVNIMTRDWPAFYGKELPFQIRHMTQFVADALKQKKIAVKKELKERIIYHDPCYLSRGVGVIEEPREVLRAIPGIELLEFDRHGPESRCCGAGGAVRKVFNDNAVAIGRLAIDEAVAKKADKLILSCPACYGKVNEAM